MSDTKWRKLFTALSESGVQVEQMLLKFIDRDLIHRVCTDVWLRTPHAYVDGQFGPTPLRDIEWIEFPAMAEHPHSSPDGKGRVPSTFTKQDIDRAEAILAEIGRFPIERTADGLRISGYIRQ